MGITETMVEFEGVLTMLANSKAAGEWPEVKKVVGRWLEHLVGKDPRTYRDLTETDLLAEVLKRSPTYSVRYKKIMFIRLLKEAGDYVAAIHPPDGGYGWYLKALNLLLLSLAQNDLAEEYLKLLPDMDSLILALGDFPVPAKTLILIMAELERGNQFGKLRDQYQAALKKHSNAPKLLAFGIGIFTRVGSHSDDILQAGGLSRCELNALIADSAERSAQQKHSANQWSDEAIWHIVKN